MDVGRLLLQNLGDQGLPSRPQYHDVGVANARQRLRETIHGEHVDRVGTLLMLPDPPYRHGPKQLGVEVELRARADEQLWRNYAPKG